MKKQSLLMAMLLMVTSFVFVSCSKEKELEKEETKTEKPNNNPLVGSVWGHSSDDNDVQWLEFIDNKNFMKYFGDKEGTPRSDVWYGTYKYSDGKVVFSETHGHNPYDYATINGSIMTLFYKTGWKITFKRKS